MPREVKRTGGSRGETRDSGSGGLFHADENENFRSGYIAVIGEPNAGKSTLINRIVGQNVSAVTRKPQTTRQKIQAILTTDHFQAIFIDTPGIIEPSYLLHEIMVQSAMSASADADVIIIAVDSSEKDHSQISMVLGRLQSLRKPLLLALNKIDLVAVKKLDNLENYFKNLSGFRKIFRVSALKGAGTRELLNSAAEGLPFHPPLYPPDIISDYPERFFVGEIIREKIFEHYQEEIPYSSAVEIVGYSEREGRKDLIRADIIVERESQKGILIGKSGRAMKEVGKKARADIEAFLGRGVFLELFVKVKPNWRNDRQLLKRLGYLS